MNGVRYWFPNCHFFLAADGIAPYQAAIEGRVAKYEEFKRRVEQKVITGEWPNVTYNAFTTREHQCGAIHWALPQMTEEFVLIQEHDCPIRTDVPIPWEVFLNGLRDQTFNVVRLPWCGHGKMHPDHEGLIYDHITYMNEPFLRVHQWSGWPHIARTEWYKDMARAVIPRGGKMVEDSIYGIAQNNPDYFRIAMWQAHDPAEMRFYHRDGRNDPATGLRDQRD